MRWHGVETGAVIPLTIAWVACVVVLAPSPCAAEPTESNDAVARSSDSEVDAPGFAYEPQAEEGPHPNSDFEWWYHFGFLKRDGSKRFDYAFVSSFQRSPKGRYLFYTLTDLATGKRHHCAVVDRSLFGVDDATDSSKVDAPRDTDDQNAAAEDQAEGESDGLLASLGKRLVRWSLGVLPVLPEGHRFMEPGGDCAKPTDTPIWFCYGDNQFQKHGPDYRALFTNDVFRLELFLQNRGHAMPVFGTGLAGIDRPEDQHYYSYPRMAARGRLQWLTSTADDKEAPSATNEGVAENQPAPAAPLRGQVDCEVVGAFWYDHQWGQVTEDALMKWCWWGLILDDGRAVNMSFLQNSDTGETVQRGLTLQLRDGATQFTDDVTFKPVQTWKSRHKRSYRVAWKVEAPKLGLAIKIEPIGNDHELPVLLYKYIWEGPCRAVVRYRDGRAARGLGFQELIGQAHE